MCIFANNSEKLPLPDKTKEKGGHYKEKKRFAIRLRSTMLLEVVLNDLKIKQRECSMRVSVHAIVVRTCDNVLNKTTRSAIIFLCISDFIGRFPIWPFRITDCGNC